ncbi:MAG: hypothetical protein KAS72_10335 [Phycisphaerales bacterium]|nr:hypothetical protein [Phycisphaerales bacterium]
MSDNIDESTPKITHQSTRLGEDSTAGAAPQGPAPTTSSKIRTFEKQRKVKEWTRKTNVTGTGATHVKSFHTKLTDDAVRYMDELINDWLEANPDYEVKLVTTSIGTFTGKLKEPHMICQVWV